MTPQPVRVASVGLGRWAGVIAEAIRHTAELEIVSCFSRSADRRRAFASAHGCRAYPSYEAILADGEIEAVLLTTPNSAHYGQILAAAQAGKHVFVEKPMTLTVEEGRAAIEACEKAGVILSVGHCWRRQEPVRRLKAMLEAGELGTVVQAVGHFGNPRALDFGQASWRSDLEEAPGGPLTGPGFHLLDIFHYLLGRVVGVWAAFSLRLTAGPAPDTTVAMLEFASGTLGQVSSSFITPTGFWFWLFGSEASAFCTLKPPGLQVQRLGTEALAPVEVPEGEMLIEQMAEFADCIRTGAHPATDGAEGLALVSMLEALAVSADSRRWEPVAAVPERT